MIVLAVAISCKRVCLQPSISHYLVTPSNSVTPQDDPCEQLVAVLRGNYSIMMMTPTDHTYDNENFGSCGGDTGRSYKDHIYANSGCENA